MLCFLILVLRGLSLEIGDRILDASVVLGPRTWEDGSIDTI